jgi:serine/threonine protein kinase
MYRPNNVKRNEQPKKDLRVLQAEKTPKDCIVGFTITRILGKGAYGAVFEAINNATNTICAIKVMCIDIQECGLPEHVISECMNTAGTLTSHLVRVNSINVNFMYPFVDSCSSVRTNNNGLEYEEGTQKTLGKRTKRPPEFSNKRNRFLENDSVMDKTRSPIGILLSFSMPKMRCSLKDVIRMLRESPGKFRMDTRMVKHITRGILNGIYEMNCAFLTHNDIKPENILIDPEGNIVVGDFGLSRKRNNYDNDHPLRWNIENMLIVTECYRPIECWLEPTYQTPVSDIFSVGCILLELFLGDTVFHSNAFSPDRSYPKKFVDFLTLNFDVMGVPDISFWKTDDQSEKLYNPDLLEILEKHIDNYRNSNKLSNTFGKLGDEDMTEYFCPDYSSSSTFEMSDGFIPNPPKGRIIRDSSGSCVKPGDTGIKNSNILFLILKQHGTECLEFVLRLLSHQIEYRFTAQEALFHTWLNSDKSCDFKNERENLIGLINTLEERSKRHKSNMHFVEHDSSNEAYYSCISQLQTIENRNYGCPRPYIVAPPATTFSGSILGDIGSGNAIAFSSRNSSGSCNSVNL